MTNEQFKRLKEAIKNFKKWKLFKIIFLLISIIIGVSTLFYTITSESVGVVMRFGEYSSTTDPGLHLKVPFFIDQVEEVPVRRQLKQEFGFGPADATYIYQYCNINTQQAEKSMVTGDSNVALVEWVVQYKVKDPKDYLFQVRRPDDTLRDASESIMREVVGD